MTLLNLELYQRLFRLVLGVYLMSVGWWGAEGPIWAVSLRVVALYPLLTGLVGWCPAKSLWRQRWDRKQVEWNDGSDPRSPDSKAPGSLEEASEETLEDPPSRAEQREGETQ